MGSLISPLKLPGLFYRAFIRDFTRVYRALSAKERIKFWWLLLLQFLVGLTETFTLLVISLFAVAVATPEAVNKSFVIIKFLHIFPSFTYFFTTPRVLVGSVSVLMTGMVFVKCVVNLCMLKALSKFVERCNKRITMDVVKHFINRDYSWHMTTSSQDAILRVFDRLYLVHFIGSTLYLYGNIITSLILFISLAILEPTLTAIVVIVFGACGCILYASVRHKLDRAGKQVFESDLESKKVLVALQKAMREIVIHRKQEPCLNHFEKVLDRSFKPRAFISYSSFIPSQVLEFVGFVTIGLMVIIMIYLGLPMDQIVSTSSILMLTAWRILPSVNRSLAYSVQIRGLRANSIVFLDLLESFKKEKDTVIPSPDPNFSFQDNINLKNVTFIYPESEREALKDLSLSIGKGENIGIIGPSGSGKSTLALILTGLVKPNIGEFLIDKSPLSPESRESYFNILGYVSQTPLILDGTIAENIAFSDYGSLLDNERLLKCAKMASLDFIEELPEGLETKLSSVAQTLSGGQIQRIAIARAFYNDPLILIFDEATSSLDLASELSIKKTLHSLKDNTTTIIIAHRLSTVENCDRLFWLEDGKIRMEGSPNTLLPLYAKELKNKDIHN
ncbi:MAG: ATP-binding cassette domain-containing protein [Deltaproteobacteria bacterium]|nr:ATP-binding cassette domain-containing protein [Deltaproteobacteria bacterium]